MRRLPWVLLALLVTAAAAFTLLLAIIVMAFTGGAFTDDGGFCTKGQPVWATIQLIEAAGACGLGLFACVQAVRGGGETKTGSGATVALIGIWALTVFVLMPPGRDC